ncbi:MAG: hypothetical protein RLZZ546_2228 [Bacteroidota bacterium]|jgi:hypothetical protein
MKYSIFQNKSSFHSQKNFLLIILSFTTILSYGQSFDLGSQITNGVTTGGCAGACSAYCTSGGSGNHPPSTCTQIVNVPAGNYMSLTCVTNACNASTDGLDNGDLFKVNGVTIVTGSGNTRVNYSGCFYNEGTADLAIPITLIVDRRDETVKVTYSFTTTNPGGCAILPISLANMEVYNNLKTVVILYETLSEINNDYFTIERSTDGSTFKELGQIKGAGNSNNIIKYQFEDLTPMNGVNYYRLKQTDYDGNYSYSGLVSVTFKGLRSVELSPTFVDDQINIYTEIENYSIAIHDISGNVVSLYENKSGNSILSINELKPAIYYVNFKSSSNTETFKIMKF